MKFFLNVDSRARRRYMISGMTPKQAEIKRLIDAAGGETAVAKLVGCAVPTVLYWISKGRLPRSPGILADTIAREAQRRCGYVFPQAARESLTKARRRAKKRSER
jgi:hypothetical protein